MIRNMYKKTVKLFKYFDSDVHMCKHMCTHTHRGCLHINANHQDVYFILRLGKGVSTDNFTRKGSKREWSRVYDLMYEVRMGEVLFCP